MNNLKRLVTLVGAAALVLSFILFAVWFFRDSGKGNLVWERPTVRKTIQPFAYKVYGKSTVDDGRYFLSKMVFRNSGTKPITDFSISYQVRGYLDWTTPETLPEIPSGNTVVKCFYPQFPAKITEIKNQTPSALEIKIHWNDGKRVREETLREEFLFRGVNEIEYTDLAANELLTWSDFYTNANLVAAMVTPNDPVVVEFAAAVSERFGGLTGGSGTQKDIEICMRSIYQYMCETGLRYNGSAGLPTNIGDTETTVQTIRLPRDVILTNNGQCIELAILWASVLEHVGIKSYIWLIPGHAFIVVKTDNQGTVVPIECTLVTATARNAMAGMVPFENAVGHAMKSWRESIAAGKYLALEVTDLQSEGIQPPELPEVKIDEVKRIIASRRPANPFFPGKQQQPAKR